MSFFSEHSAERANADLGSPTAALTCTGSLSVKPLPFSFRRSIAWFGINLLPGWHFWSPIARSYRNLFLNPSPPVDFAPFLPKPLKH
jgi:hypothetical protein